MIKRFFDLISSVVGLIILFPLLMMISILIKLNSKGPILFLQERVGLDAKLFKVLKFRTMFLNSQKNGLLTIGNDPRITSVGFFLRRYKLDELPQLVNVLKGEMSIVGPRPEVPEFIKLYKHDIREKILSIKPGLTDLASIKLINESQILSSYKDPYLAYKDKLLRKKQKYYLFYKNNKNICLDIKIIFLTIKRIFS